MNSADTLHRPLWHRLAWLTAVLALLPVTVGAAVTTLDAGMAFRDWPTSNGYGMLQFPWFSTIGEPDKFLEHGHRLAGLLIGCLALVTAILTWTLATPVGIRRLATGILLAVIGQGLLGGMRVRLDERVFAMLHGWFAAVVCGLLAWQVMLTSRRWLETVEITPSAIAALNRTRAWSHLLAVTVIGQYLLGGLLRHLKHPEAWLIHPWFAIAVLVVSLAHYWSARTTGSAWLIRGALAVLGIIIFQFLLGLATWAAKYGFPEWGIMAYHYSSFQTAACTLHKVCGLLTWMATFAAVVRVEHLRSGLFAATSTSRFEVRLPLLSSRSSWGGAS